MNLLHACVFPGWKRKGREGSEREGKEMEGRAGSEREVREREKGEGRERKVKDDGRHMSQNIRTCIACLLLLFG